MKKWLPKNWFKLHTTKLHKIEERILYLKGEITETPIGPYNFIKPEWQLASLKNELENLETERQFILDKRDNLFWRFIWNVIVPIVVSTITAYTVSVLSK